MVALGLSLALVAENFSFAASDLVTERRDLHLHVIIRSALVVEVVARVVALLLEPVESDAIGVLAGLELVLLKQFFVLKVTVFGLDAVQLVAQGAVVLVSLLDLEDLGL